MKFTEFCFKILKLSLTRGQFALARVAFDGGNPESTLEHEFFGDAVSIPEGARSTIILRCGRGSGKSLLAAARVIYSLVYGDVSKVGPGDEPCGIVIAPTRDLAKIAFNAGSALIRGNSLTRKMIVSDTADSITLKRPDGSKVVFRVVAKSAKGTATRGRSFVAVLFDESEFLPANGEAAVLDSDLVSAVRPRMLPGAQLILASTPWPAKSFTADTFDSNFGKPTVAIAARATTLQMRDFPAHLVKVRDEEIARDPNNALREFDCIITDAQGCFFEASNIDRAVSQVVRITRTKASVAIDLAFKSDSSAFVAVERQGDKLVVVDTIMRSPKANKPLIPSEVIGEFAHKAASFKVKHIMSDSHYIETAREHAGKQGIELILGPVSAGERERSFVYVRELLREGKLLIPENPGLISQLKSVLCAAKPGGGLAIMLPRRAGSGHADLVSALILACWNDRKHGPLLKASTKSDIPKGVKTRYAWK